MKMNKTKIYLLHIIIWLFSYISFAYLGQSFLQFIMFEDLSYLNSPENFSKNILIYPILLSSILLFCIKKFDKNYQNWKSLIKYAILIPLTNFSISISFINYYMLIIRKVSLKSITDYMIFSVPIIYSILILIYFFKSKTLNKIQKTL